MCEVTSKLPVQISPFLYYDYPLLHEAPSGKKMYPLLKLANLILIIGRLLHKKYYYKVICNQRHYWGYMTNKKYNISSWVALQFVYLIYDS